MSLKENLFADYDAVQRGIVRPESDSRPQPTWLRLFVLGLRSPGFRVVVFYRLGHHFRSRGPRVVAGVFDRLIWMHGIDIHTRAEIGPGFLLPHPIGVAFSSGVRLGRHVIVLQGVTIGQAFGPPNAEGRTEPIIGDDVVIACGAKVLGPITVGNRVWIGANAVVIRDVPDDCVAVGVPARIIKQKGQRIPLAQQQGELSEVLRQLSDRIDTLQKRIDELT